MTDHAHGGFTFDSSEIAVVLATAGVIQFFYQVPNLPFYNFEKNYTTEAAILETMFTELLTNELVGPIF